MKPYYEDGSVTIWHGDARELLPAMDEASIDFIFTDPPYGHNNNNNDLIHRWEAALGKPLRGLPAEKARPIANDGPEANELIQWFFEQAARLLKPGCCCCCCCGGGGGPDPQFARWSLWLDQWLSFKQMIVWDKGGLGMGWHYRRNYETVLVAEKPGAACRWYGGNKAANVIRFPKILPSQDQHPTQKPIELASLFIGYHSQPGDLVLDPFMGSGTTLEAAKSAGRRAIGIELEERWCEMAAQRLAQEVLRLDA